MIVISIHLKELYLSRGILILIWYIVFSEFRWSNTEFSREMIFSFKIIDNISRYVGLKNKFTITLIKSSEPVIFQFPMPLGTLQCVGKSKSIDY